jgi:hypothetical protein
MWYESMSAMACFKYPHSCEPYSSEVHFPFEYFKIAVYYFVIGSATTLPLGFGNLSRRLNSFVGSAADNYKVEL